MEKKQMTSSSTMSAVKDQIRGRAGWGLPSHLSLAELVPGERTLRGPQEGLEAALKSKAWPGRWTAEGTEGPTQLPA